eukprot:547591_1
MENKSLNIFNTKYVLASPDTATDTDYHNIQRVIGHEYFHNYTGNRVTCRDWFQLSLKEGLTVFRDQEFSSDYNDRGVERIDQIQMLQATQFKEDASPMAHAVRPDEYMEINNFYTVTVYEKGAEIVRMMETIIGREKFKMGLNLYLNEHDGEACTIEDFVACMQQASGVNLDQFLSSWYAQPGTPQVTVATAYNKEDKAFTIHLKQSNASPQAPNPYVIPLNLSLLNRKMDENHTIPYELIGHKSLRTLKRNPLLTSRLLCLPSFEYLFGLLSDDGNAAVDPELLMDCIENVKSRVGYTLYPQLVNSYTWCRDQLSMLSLYPNYNQSYEGWLKGRKYRSLLNVCLHYMVSHHEAKNYKQKQQSAQILFEQYQLSRNMTEMFGALNALVNSNRSDLNNEKHQILQHFHRHFADDKLVIQKWLRLQSTAHGDANIMNTMQQLLNHTAYDSNNPNFIYSLVGGFAFANAKGFHQANGQGYQFVANQVLHYDAINSSVAARLCKAFENANKLDANRQSIIYNELEAILRQDSLSKGTYEIAHKILDSIDK